MEGEGSLPDLCTPPLLSLTSIKVVPASLALAAVQFRLNMHTNAQMQWQRCIDVYKEVSACVRPPASAALCMLSVSPP